MRKSISAQESMDAMDLESDPDLQPSLLLVEQTEADSNNNSNNIASTSMKREVTVRFRGTKAALGPHRQCQAVVTEDFMHHFTTLNEILVKGNPFVEFPDVPSSSSNNAITLEVDGEYRKPPVTSSSLLSAYGKELLGNKKFPEKLLTTLDSATMPVHCVLDMWLWLEVQKYFSLVTASTHDANVLQLLGRCTSL